MVTEREKRRHDTLLSRRPPGRIPHWEAWSNPDAESYLTGIDYYQHPRLCRLRLRELYPELGLSVPESDTPKKRPTLGGDGSSADLERHTVRWGDGESGTWAHGEKYFTTEEEVFRFDPLEHADMRDWPHVVVNWDFRSEEAIYERLRADYPSGWSRAPAGSDASCGFYNTMFMWPLLTFGWEMFLACCLDERFAPVMAGFAEINRRVFRAMSRLPVNFVVCHDDIVMTRGPVCSPAWMHRYIYPCYEEFWSILKSSGKTVIFMTDGCADAVIEDVIACGAAGLVSEPHTDYRRIARKHPDFFVAGEGDNRILKYGDSGDIERMVDEMVLTASMTGGYMLAIGNHIPWDIPPEAVKLYLDLCEERAWRRW